MSFIRQAFEKRTASFDALMQVLTAGRGGWATTWAGVPINEVRAMQHLTVHRCVSLISSTVAQLPVKRYRDDGPARIPLDDPPFLSHPSAGTTWVEWCGQVGVSLLLRGNAYGDIVSYDARGYPTQIQLWHPDEVNVVRGSDGITTYSLPGGRKERRYPAGNMWHVKGLGIPGVYRSIVGLDPIAYAAQTIGTGLAAEEYAARFFSEGATPSGLLTTDQDIDEATASDMQDRWVNAHGSMDRRPAVLGGGLKYDAVQLSPEASQFLETIKAKREEIAGFYGVPLHMVGLADKQSNWGTGVEENARQFVDYTLGIWLKRIESSLTDLFPRPQYIRFNVAGLLRGRLTERYNAYQMARNGGWLSIDDIRALEEMPPLEDEMGSDYLTPLNYQAIPEGGLVNELPPPPVTEAAPSTP